jgi:hypothetical protein
VIGLAPKQLADSLKLPVGEPERAVDRLFFDLRQSWFSLSVRLDVTAVELDQARRSFARIFFIGT